MAPPSKEEKTRRIREEVAEKAFVAMIAQNMTGYAPDYYVNYAFQVADAWIRGIEVDRCGDFTGMTDAQREDAWNKLAYKIRDPEGYAKDFPDSENKPVDEAKPESTEGESLSQPTTGQQQLAGV